LRLFFEQILEYSIISDKALFDLENLFEHLEKLIESYKKNHPLPADELTILKGLDQIEPKTELLARLFAFTRDSL